MTRCDTLSHLGSAQNSQKAECVMVPALSAAWFSEGASLRQITRLPRCSLRTRSGARHPRHARAPGAHCAWLRVAPLLPSPSLRAVAQVLPGRGGKAGLPIELESRPGGIESLARLQNCFSSPHQADPRPHAEPSPLFDPPEAGRMSGCPPSRRFFAATVRRSGQGMKRLRGAHPARVP